MDLLDIYLIMDKISYLASLELRTVLGLINFFAFLASLVSVASKRFLRAIGWFLNYILFSCYYCNSKNKPEPPVFPEDDKGPWAIMFAFVGLIICICFISRIN